jgi:hypothetical protein
MSGLNFGLRFGIISVLVSLILSAQAEAIALTERLHWTRRSLMRSLLTPKHVREVLLVTGGLGLGLGLSEGLGYGLSEALIFGLLYWILLGLLQGVSSEQIEDHARLLPNQGIRRSLLNSVLLALISIGIIGVIGELSVVLGSGLSYALNFTFFGPSEMLRWGLEGLRWGLEALLSYWPDPEVLILAVCGGLLVGVSHGGLAALRHSILFLLLQRAGVVPRHYVRFLDEAASCILLRKVGGATALSTGFCSTTSPSWRSNQALRRQRRACQHLFLHLTSHPSQQRRQSSLTSLHQRFLWLLPLLSLKRDTLFPVDMNRALPVLAFAVSVAHL